jgi:hypothetical protein
MLMSTSGKVNIRPGVSVLSVLRHLNYSPWFAHSPHLGHPSPDDVSARSRYAGLRAFGWRDETHARRNAPSRIFRRRSRDRRVPMSREDA